MYLRTYIHTYIHRVPKLAIPLCEGCGGGDVAKPLMSPLMPVPQCIISITDILSTYYEKLPTTSLSDAML